MGLICINQTDAKQSIILNTSEEGVSGGWYAPDGTYTDFNADPDYSSLADGSMSGTLYIHEAETIRSYGCANLPNITAVVAPVLQASGDHGFFQCYALEYAVFPAVTQLQPSSLRSCTALKGVDILGRAAAQSISNQSMMSCTNLTVMVIRNKDEVAHLSSTNAFDSTPFANGGSGGTLYVPNDLIASYQAATNWSTILGYTNNQIKAIEESVYETKYVDGSPIGG